VKRLVIDTATRACSVALFQDDRLVDARHEAIGRGHAERLVPMIAELADHARADVISVNIGPGSFTGIRVGVSAAKALALAWSARCEGYNGLALIAAITQDGSAGSAVDVAINGGHGELFFQPFDAAGWPTAPPLSVRPEIAVGISQAPVIAGDAAATLAALRGSGKPIQACSDASKWPLIAHLDSQPPSPAYVRGPDAKPPTDR
jgi:tRNA threonylcarbamoyl adenosine modification protein YeaZ